MSTKTAQEEQDFKVAMQQLSAEAEKILPMLPPEENNSSAEAEEATQQPQGPDSFAERLHGLENSVLNHLERIAAEMEASRAAAFAEQFKKIDEQLASIRSTESVNQQLFDSLHGELLTYRDNFLHESLQKPFIHDLVHLFDDLSSLATQLGSSAHETKKRGNIAQWRDN